MTDHKLEDVLQYFKNGLHKILIATSVAEEGLDVRSCNYVIRYLHVTNDIARIQSRGLCTLSSPHFYYSVAVLVQNIWRLLWRIAVVMHIYRSAQLIVKSYGHLIINWQLNSSKYFVLLGATDTVAAAFSKGKSNSVFSWSDISCQLVYGVLWFRGQKSPQHLSIFNIQCF